MIIVHLSYKIMLRIKPLDMYKIFGTTSQHSSNSICVWVCVCMFSHSVVTLRELVDWAHQDPLSIGFSKWEYWSGLPFPPSGDLPNTGTEPMSPMFPAFTDRLFISEPAGWPRNSMCCAQQLCCVQLFVIPWTVACQTPLSLGILQQECWCALQCCPPGDLPNPGINPDLPHCRWIIYSLSHQGSTVSYF